MKVRYIDRGLQKPVRVRREPEKPPKRLALAKPVRVRSEQMLAWIHDGMKLCFLFPVDGQNCAGPLEAAHVTLERGTRSAASKSSDWHVLPGCRYHHQGPYGLDTLGNEKFEERYGVSLPLMVIRYLTWFLEEQS